MRVKAIVPVMLFLAFCQSSVVLLAANNRCPSDMVYIPPGKFTNGISVDEMIYLSRLCNDTVGGCYESWFRTETLRQNLRMDGFCVDRYEYPNKQGAMPESGRDWRYAVMKCDEKQKKLCTQYEWERVCEGRSGNRWSFGKGYSPGLCNLEGSDVATSGSYFQCKSEEGVYDLNGNVAEWVAAPVYVSNGQASINLQIVKGGGYEDFSIYSRCTFNDFRDKGDYVGAFGFRCCSSSK